MFVEPGERFPGENAAKEARENEEQAERDRVIAEKERKQAEAEETAFEGLEALAASQDVSVQKLLERAKAHETRMEEEEFMALLPDLKDKLIRAATLAHRLGNSALFGIAHREDADKLGVALRDAGDLVHRSRWLPKDQD